MDSWLNLIHRSNRRDGERSPPRRGGGGRDRDRDRGGRDRDRDRGRHGGYWAGGGGGRGGPLLARQVRAAHLSGRTLSCFFSTCAVALVKQFFNLLIIRNWQLKLRLLVPKWAFYLSYLRGSTGWHIRLWRTSRWLQIQVPFWPVLPWPGRNGTFILMSTGDSPQPDVSPCTCVLAS